MNFDDCVLKFFFNLFTCDDHGDPVLFTFQSNFRSFVVSMICTINIWSTWVIVDFFSCATINFLCAISANFCL